jgi:hypothetical protein
LVKIITQNIIVMLKYVIFFWINLVVIGTYAQEENSVDPKTTKKLTKQQKMEQKKIEEEAMAKMVDQMVQYRKFVLEANYLSNQRGERIIVSSNINFIAVDSNRITIQLASVTGVGGWNGMGGVTTDGTISKFEIKKSGRSRDVYTIQIYTMTRLGSYDILFTITPSGNADASIGGSWSGKLNYHGYLVPLHKSKVFKAMSI